jgi:hypothetical protein
MPRLKPPPVTPSASPKNTGLGDRLAAAAAAKNTMLERFRSKQADPAVLERQAELKAISAARDARQAERKAVREAEASRLAAERAAAAAEQAAREAEERRLAKEAAGRTAALEAQQKAARDARYAARKARR